MLSGRHRALGAIRTLGIAGQSREGHKLAVTLKKDVEDLGVEGDKVVVRAGHMRNYLHPEKLAVYAPWSNKPMTVRVAPEAEVPKKKVKAAAKGDDAITRNSLVRQQLKFVLKKLTSNPVVMHVAAEGEKAVEPVNAKKISFHIARHMGIHLPVELMDLKHGLMDLKTHKIPLGLTLDIREPPVLNVKLVAKDK